MWTLLVLCTVVTVHGAPGAGLYNATTPAAPKYQTTHDRTCRYNCGRDLGYCSCTSSCQYYGNCCSDYQSYCSSTTEVPTTGRTCRYNCGRDLGYCSCTSSCQYRGNCCYDYQSYCSSTSGVNVTDRTCRNNCGRDLGYCSCTSSCQYYGNCCFDYQSYCSSTTEVPTTGAVLHNVTTTAATTYQTTHGRTCRYNCGRDLGYCSCTSSCQYYGNCCSDYQSYCSSTTEVPTTDRTCRNNCGRHLGYCSCTSSCQYYGNCCFDYQSYCSSTTEVPTTGAVLHNVTTTAATTYQTTHGRTCRYNCGRDLGYCSCTSSCQYYGNCCSDYQSYCSATSAVVPTTGRTCRYNCGRDLGYCSCTSSCQYYGNCCSDYQSYCSATSAVVPTTGRTCRYNCGRDLGYCSCTSSCQYYGNCCSDYQSYCSSTSTVVPTTDRTCRYNCGRDLGYCSCTSSCQYRGNCCYDYQSYCSATSAVTATDRTCRNNCGRDLGYCSCTSSCQYRGNCCYDYYYQCSSTSAVPATAEPCGRQLIGSGTFSSPNHPNHYPDGANCVWQIKTTHDQRILLKFTFMQLDSCCSCDYVQIYDGPSVNSRYLGKVCNSTLNSFYSTSNYMTVAFRSDGSVVGRGFKADFISSLPSSAGRVECSASSMNIVLERSYLNSLGFYGHNLTLEDGRCRPQVSSYQVSFRYPINTCGNTREFTDGTATYNNFVTSFTSETGEITRQSFLKLKVACRMEKESVSQIMYLVEHNQNSTIVGSGSFNTSMKFYTSSGFYSEVTEFPYEVTLNQYMYVQVSQTVYDSSLVLFLDTCVASPSPNDFQTRAYYLVRNGCTMDNTYQVYSSGTQPYARFRFQAFQFLRGSDSVYIQCKVLVCQAQDYNSRCRRGCMTRTARDLGSEHHSQTMVLGPIKLQDPGRNEEGTQKQEKV